MTTEEQYLTLKNIWISPADIEEILACTGNATKIRLLRKHRFRILEGIHKEQQALDSLDYFICRIENTTKNGA